MKFKPRKTLHIGTLIIKYRIYLYRSGSNLGNLVQNHFSEWSDVSHINSKGFEIAVQYLNGEPALIVETGTSAWGTDSTRLWDTYIRKFGGQLFSVDIRKEASENLKFQLTSKSKLVVDDSISFLNKWNLGIPNLYYLDSWDLDLNSPEDSAFHGKSEIMAIIPFLKSGSLILIDDTPNPNWFNSQPKLPDSVFAFRNEFGVFPGKGAFIAQVLDGHFNYEILHHDYSLLIRISSSKKRLHSEV